MPPPSAAAAAEGDWWSGQNRCSCSDFRVFNRKSSFFSLIRPERGEDEALAGKAPDHSFQLRRQSLRVYTIVLLRVVGSADRDGSQHVPFEQSGGQPNSDCK